MAEKSKELALVSASNFALMQVDTSDLAEVFQENLAGDSLRVSDLTSIHIPAAGNVSWSIPTIDGETSTPSLQGVVIAHRNVRRFYAQDFATSGGGTAPDCKSEDGIHGVGAFATQCGGLCANCPMAQFSKDDKGNWSATKCKQYTLVFLVREDAVLPSILVVAPTSIKEFSTYKRALAVQKMKRLSEVLTEFTLTKERSPSGFTYSKLAVRPVEYFDKETQVKFRDFGRQMESFLSAYIAPDNLDSEFTKVETAESGDAGAQKYASNDVMDGFSERDLEDINIDDIPTV
jgi:hypothetical protein